MGAAIGSGRTRYGGAGGGGGGCPRSHNLLDEDGGDSRFLPLIVFFYQFTREQLQLLCIGLLRKSLPLKEDGFYISLA